MEDAFINYVSTFAALLGDVNTRNDFCGTFICDDCYSVFGSCNEIERVEKPSEQYPLVNDEEYSHSIP